ncbi:MAG: ABC transporter periplasmic subunit [Erysipelotrichaceae bacterium]|nr:MAG: ABC transporter periplasmic [Erysipelotrichaceae bacterium]TXT18533.1 MAG: ABC transporter periplasmic subunit [Erysipelotrichaceae bacterium]
MKKLIGVLILALLVLSGFTACSSKPKTIKIGLNLELTGEISVYGVPEKLAAEMAVAEINKAGGIDGKTVELIIYDNAYNSAKAVENSQKLIQQGVVAILGSATSAPTLAIGPVALDSKVLTITPSGTNAKVTMNGTAVNPFVFRACFIDPFQGLVLANFASDNLDAKKAVVMGSNSSDYAKDLASIFTDQFEANGGEVLGSVFYYADTDADFSAQLTAIAALGEFDVLFVADYAARAGLIINQARATAGLETVAILGPDGFESPDLNDLAGGAAKVNNVFFSTHFSTIVDNAKVKKFIADYTTSAGEAPSALSALAYDAMYMLFAAIDKAGTNPVKVRDALKATVGFDGVTGTISFDDLNNPIKSAIVVELTNGVQTNAVIVNP